MAARTHRLLLIEDSEPLAIQVMAALHSGGYEATWMGRADEALSANFDRFSLVILDLTLPDGNGFEILEHMRRHGVRTPVMVASARNDSRDRRRALDLGAFDYLTKPFWPQELLQRVASRLARPEPSERPNDVVVAGLTIDPVARAVTLDGTSVPMTPIEFGVLQALTRRAGEAVSRGWLLEQMTLEDSTTVPREVDACVARLKVKLGRIGAHIKSVWGVGYRLDV
jgi:DNA-binding response OmpR family regulator